MAWYDIKGALIYYHFTIVKQSAGTDIDPVTDADCSISDEVNLPMPKPKGFE
ncbi:hypothetical protein D3C81_869150 [compost metagenome]